MSEAKARVATKLRMMARVKPVEALSGDVQKLKEHIRSKDETEISTDELRNPILVMMLYFVAYLGMTAFLFAAPGKVSAIVVWSTITLAGGTKKLLGPEHVKNWLWALYWYLNLLLALPATLMANGDFLGHSTADLGGKLFLFMLWMLGWLFLWVMTVSGKLANPTKYLDSEQAEKEGRKPVKVDYEAQMTSMPTAIPFKIKLLTGTPSLNPHLILTLTSPSPQSSPNVAVAYEGYTYSGFSFFPALPWSEVPVPTGVILALFLGLFRSISRVQIELSEQACPRRRTS